MGAWYGRAMPPAKRALFLDWGGTLARTENNRTVVDTAGHPVLMPNVVATLARERPRFDACFIVSNQARVSKGEISYAVFCLKKKTYCQFSCPHFETVSRGRSAIWPHRIIREHIDVASIH